MFQEAVHPLCRQQQHSLLLFMLPMVRKNQQLSQVEKKLSKMLHLIVVTVTLTPVYKQKLSFTLKESFPAQGNIDSAIPPIQVIGKGRCVFVPTHSMSSSIQKACSLFQLLAAVYKPF